MVKTCVMGIRIVHGMMVRRVEVMAWDVENRGWAKLTQSYLFRLRTKR